MIAGLGALAGCNGGSNGTIVITHTPTPVATSTPAPTASATPTSAPSATQTPTPTASPTSVASLSSISGTLQGGLIPVSGAAVMLYAAGTAYGSNATLLASNTSDSNGKFAVGYSPPGTPTVLYLVALGGVAGPATNTAIGLIGVAGMSNTLPASVTINELTTVATEWALAQFIDSTGQVIGAPPSNTTGFTNAVNQVRANLVDIATGTPASFLPWSSSSASCTAAQNCDGLERMDTLANILAACVESTGASSIACNTLLSFTGNGNNTLQAAHAIATNPTRFVGAILGLQSSSNEPFEPALSFPADNPNDLTLALNFSPSGANLDGPSGLAIDAAGNIWLTNFTGNSVTELTSSGALAGNFAPSGANFDTPVGVAIDASGNVWVPNFIGNSVTELTSSGALAGDFAPSGANFNRPAGVSINAAGNVWVTNVIGNSVTELTSSGALAGNFAPGGANFNVPNIPAIDAGGNVWVPNQFGNSVTELTSSGALAGNFAPSGANFNNPLRVAIDAGGNVWVPNSQGNSVTELTASGGLVGNFTFPLANFNTPNGVAIDAADNVWVTNSTGNSVSELPSSGALPSDLSPSGANLDGPASVAIDASGNLWVVNANGDSVAEIIGVARPVLVPLVACLKQTLPHAVCLP